MWRFSYINYMFFRRLCTPESWFAWSACCLSILALLVLTWVVAALPIRLFSSLSRERESEIVEPRYMDNVQFVVRDFDVGRGVHNLSHDLCFLQIVQSFGNPHMSC